MKVLILGSDGYIGFPLSMHLANIGYDVVGVDNFLRRKCVAEVRSHSATPIRSMSDRLETFEKIFGKKIYFDESPARQHEVCRSRTLCRVRPEARWLHPGLPR